MNLSSDVYICDIDHQNIMTEINSFDIYFWHIQSVYDTCQQIFNRLHEKNHLVVEWHLKLYFWLIWWYFKSEV